MNTATSLSKYLRLTGIIAIGISVIQFLISGRYDLNSFVAYNLFLGVNALICLLGVISYTKYKDKKTARTFLGISLAIIPAQFAQLGAFIYSKYSVQTQYLPSILNLKLPDDVSLKTISLLSLIILIPSIILSFSVFNKRFAKSLSFNYLISSLIIILPMRTPMSAIIILIAYYLLNSKTIKLMGESNTFESKLSKAMLYIPFAIVLGRSLFYPLEFLYYGALLILFGFSMFTSLAKSLGQDNPKAANSVQALSLIPILIGNIFILSDLGSSLALMVYSFGAILQFLSLLSVSDGENYRLSSIIVIFIGLVLIMNDRIGLSLKLCYLPLPVLATFISYQFKELKAFNVGLISICLYSMSLLKTMIIFPQIGLWQSLIAIGIIAIIGAGFIERHFEGVKTRIRLLYKQFN